MSKSPPICLKYRQYLCFTGVKNDTYENYIRHRNQRGIDPADQHA